MVPGKCQVPGRGSHSVFSERRMEDEMKERGRKERKREERKERGKRDGEWVREGGEGKGKKKKKIMKGRAEDGG